MGRAVLPWKNCLEKCNSTENFKNDLSDTERRSTGSGFQEGCELASATATEGSQRRAVLLLWEMSHVLVLIIHSFICSSIQSFIHSFMVILKNMYFSVKRFSWPGKIGIEGTLWRQTLNEDVNSLKIKARADCLQWWNAPFATQPS